MLTLLNARTGDVVASVVEVADTRAARRRGLLGRDQLDMSSALILWPCCVVHTAFMRFSIDVVFLDRSGSVMRLVHDLSPWRVAGSKHARAVIEFPGGSLRARDLRVGDRLYFSSVSGVEDGGVSSLFSFDGDVSLRTMASRPACSGS